MKKILSLILVLSMIMGLGAFVPTVFAAASGTCGANLTWTLDNSGKLTISGSGAMTNWSSDPSVPWYSYRDSIKSVVINEGVTTIGDYAFDRCPEITTIKIPKTVTSIGDNGINENKKLVSIMVTSGNSNYSSADGVLYNKDKTTLINYPSAKTDTSFTVPSTVTRIESMAIKHNPYLKTVSLPNGITYIGAVVFQDCSALTTVNIPESLEYILGLDFSNCPSLKSLDFPASVKSIASSACGNGTVLTTVKIRNHNCTISASFSSSAVIWGYAGSTAQTYAQSGGNTFRAFVESVSLSATAATVNKGATKTLTATVLPTIAYNKNVTWSSSNTAVATVDTSGKVTAVSYGTATITVKSNEDSSIRASCVITVPTPQYTVSYNANGGTGAPAAQTKTYGVDLTLSSAKPTRTGYSFTGWNTNANGTGTAYSSGGKYTANAAVTLYAQWKLETYSVSYNANGGENAPAAQTKTYGVDLTLSSAKPTRTGYSFTGWNTNANGTGTAYSSGGKYTANAAVTLYAQWKLEAYSVSYDANGGENAPASQIKDYGQNITLSSQIPTREGFKFTGWNTTADGSGTDYAPGEVYTNNAPLSLSAQWAEYKRTRIFGNSRYDTAKEISDVGWPDGADTVVLANGTNFADALAGGPLAYAIDAPILLTAGKAQLEESVAAQIEALGAENIVLLGGSAAISNEIEDALSQNYTVERVYGTTRYDTALEISKLVNPNPSTVFVVTGTGYADALSVSPYAAMKGYPIVYSNPLNGLTDETVEYLANTQKIYIIGGEMAVGQNTVDQLEGKDAERIFGTSRYLTSFEIASKFADEFGDSVMFATGTNFPDALAGGVLGAKLRSPLLLVHPSGAIDEIKNFVLTKDPANIYILGGTGAVPDSVIEGIFE